MTIHRIHLKFVLEVRRRSEATNQEASASSTCEINRQAIVAENLRVRHSGQHLAEEIDALLPAEGERLTRAFENRHDHSIEKRCCSLGDVDVAEMDRVECARV